MSNNVPGTAARPLLVVISAPSGAGKSTLCNLLLRDCPNLVRVITCTTRAPRGTERDGIDYHFLARPEFERRIRAGAFLEHAVVHGNRYGTLAALVRRTLAAGRDMALVIDVQGAAQVRSRAARDPVLRRALIDIFIAPPSMQVLRQRLVKRGEDTPAVVRQRIRNAATELRCWRKFRYLVINDRLPDARARLRAIVAAEKCRVV